MTSGWPLVALLVPLLAAATGTDPVPHPALDGLEPAVAGQIRELKAGLERAPGGDPAQRAERYGELGALYHSLDFFEAALACYRTAETLAPGDGRWPYMQGVLHTDTGDVATAQRDLLRAIALRPGLNTGWARLGRLALDAGEPQQALLHFQRALSTMPESAAALAGAGQALLALGRPEEAAEHLEKALEIEPRANRLHYPLAMAYRALGDMEAMRSHLDRVGAVGVTVDDPIAEYIARRTAGARVHVQQGNRAYRAGDYATAADAFTRAAQAAPEEATAWINLGAAQVALDRPDQARRSFRRALELSPGNATALENMLALLMDVGENGAARALLDEHLPGDSESRKLIHARAVLRRDTGDPAAAVADYRRLTKLEPASDRAWKGLVAATIEAGELDRVESLLREAGSALEDPASFRLELVDSLVAAYNGNPAEAALARRIAQALFEDEPSAPRALRVGRSLLLGSEDCTAAARWLEARANDEDLDDTLRRRLRDMQAELAALERCGDASAPDAGG